MNNDRAKELEGLLGDLICALRYSPSCQSGVNDPCHCRMCVVSRANAALSQQAEPVPAQDELEAVERFSPTTSVPHCGRASEVEAYMTEDDDGEYMTVSQHERIVAALTRPAQAEPVCDTMQRPKAVCGCPDCGSSLIELERIKTARQPEQSGLEEALNEAHQIISLMSRMFGDEAAVRSGHKGAEQRRQAQSTAYRWLEKHRAALAAQGGE